MLSRRTCEAYGTGIAICCIIAALYAAFIAFTPSKLVTMCEEAIKREMASPSGYNRTSVFAHDEPVEIEEYKNFLAEHLLLDTNKAELDRIVAFGLQPTLHLVSIEYDDPNVYGVPIRRSQKCMYASEDGSLDGLTRIELVVGGKSVRQLAAEQEFWSEVFRLKAEGAPAP